MCMAGHITSDAAQGLRGSHDHALEAPWDLSDFFIQWPEKLQLNIKSSTSMKKCWPPEIDKSLERPQKSFMPSVQFSRSVVSNSLDPWTGAYQASLSITNSWSLLKLMSIESVIPSKYLILCRPLLLLPSIFSSISLFKWVSCLHQVAKVLESQLQHQSFQWIFRTDFL